MSPMPPRLDGVLTRRRHAFMRSANFASFPRSPTSSIHRDDVWPSPPLLTSSASAMSSAWSKSRLLYMPRIVVSFSCPNASELSVEDASPMSTFVDSGTSKPAILAIVTGRCPTIFAFSAPLMRSVARILSASSLLRK